MATCMKASPGSPSATSSSDRRRATVKGEYLYVDVPGTSFTSMNRNPVAFPISTITHTHGDVKESVARIGVNYKFW
jgi:hypothetical protein